VYEVDPKNIANTMTLREFCHDRPDLWSEMSKTVIDVTKIDLLDSPSADSLHYSIEKLFVLGAIDSNCIPTKLGFIINRFRFVNVEGIRAILAGYVWGASIIDLIDIISVLEIGLDRVFPEGLGQGALSYRDFQYLVADDFIMGAHAFQTFQHRLGEIKSSSGLQLEESIGEWAEAGSADRPKMSLENLYQCVELREEILNSLCMIGYNPYANFESSLRLAIPQELLPIIKKLKQCIFEGYKMNLAVWSPTEQAYKSRKVHISVEVDPSAAGGVIQTASSIAKFGDSNPRYLIYHKLTCEPNPNSVYKITSDAISVMDGYVTVDPNFDVLLFK
jgi:hypothetical protein